MDIDFPRWLAEQRKERGWSQADLARAARISPQVVSDYEGYKRKYFDETILQKIAKGFKIPVETVYRAAGFLPPATEVDEIVAEINHLLEGLPPDVQEEAREYIRMKSRMVEEREAKARQTDTRKPKPRQAGT
jgi:transcriptional regulator with XRE-family HTH domain